MLFEQLHTNILDLSDEERITKFKEYAENRERELTMVQIKVKKKKSPGAKKKKGSRVIAVSPEQLEILRKVGLI